MKDTIERNGKKYECVWMEDDARPPGAETLYAAYRRLFGKLINLVDSRSKRDRGDVVEYDTNDGAIVFLSYPGNSAIYKEAES